MIFGTKVAGIPCQCEVIGYSPPIPIMITGSGMGDAIPPEPEDFEFRLLDSKGRHAPWLERKLHLDDEDRLLTEYHKSQRLEEYNHLGVY